MALERNTQSKIVERLGKVPYSAVYVNHGSAFQRRGRPDIEFFVRNGKSCRAFFFELKQPKSETSRLQSEEIIRLLRAGCVAAVVRSWEDVETILKEYGIIGKDSHGNSRA